MQHTFQIALAVGGLFLQTLSFAQTQIDLRTQTKQVDFSSAASTRPMKVGPVLPTSCQTGEFFFKTSAIPGANVYGCTISNVWLPQAGLPAQGNSAVVLTSDGTSASWIDLDGDLSGPANTLTVKKLQNKPVSSTPPVAGQALIWNGLAWQPQTMAGLPGTLTLQNNGTDVGVRGVQNVIAGNGVVHLVTDTGTKLNIETMIDSAVVETKTSTQAGGSLLCISSSASGTAYLCGTTPPLTAYRKGMVLRWIPDVDATGVGITLDVDGLGAKAVKLADGVGDPISTDVSSGGLYEIWYDGGIFRLFNAVARMSSGTPRPACDATLRGRLWQIFADSTVKDEVAVCTKDDMDVYAWRVLY